MHLLASDFDGTLFINETVNEIDQLSIKNFRDTNNKFVICTGRPINSVLAEMSNYNLPYDYVIGVNGAIAVDASGKELFAHELDELSVAKIKQILLKNNIKDYILSDGYNQVTTIGSSISPEDEKKISKVRAYYIDAFSAENALILAKQINQELAFANIIAYPNNEFVSIGMKGIHKGYGVKKLTDIINWGKAIHVVGDDYNDIPMFKRYNSYGIKSGVKEAIAYTKHQVFSVDEALNHILHN